MLQNNLLLYVVGFAKAEIRSFLRTTKGKIHEHCNNVHGSNMCTFI